METIKTYLENMFAGLPKTARVTELKDNILSNMEDKYNELKKQGKSENEAIGIVISEFGNIDELVSELGIHKSAEVNTKPVVTQEEVDRYLNVKRVMGIQIGIGVFLCILAPAMLILISHLLETQIIPNNLSENASGVPGLIILFLLIAAAVGLFIFSGMNFERYKYLENGVQLPLGVEQNLKQQYDRFHSTFYLCVIVGVCLVVISPIALFISTMINDSATQYGVVILLIIVALAVFLFISSGSIREGYQRLLEIEDYSRKSKKENKVIGAVASIVWPLAVIIFLFCGFVYKSWNISWVVFPITGLLFGMFCAAYSIITGTEK